MSKKRDLIVGCEKINLQREDALQDLINSIWAQSEYFGTRLLEGTSDIPDSILENAINNHMGSLVVSLSRQLSEISHSELEKLLTNSIALTLSSLLPKVFEEVREGDKQKKIELVN